jgi:hypothetical protein
MSSQEQLKRDIASQREQLASALNDLRGDVSKVKTRLPLALAGLGALRLALKLKRR